MRHENPMNARRYRPRPPPVPRKISKEDEVKVQMNPGGGGGGEESEENNNDQSISSLLGGCVEGFTFTQPYRIIAGFLFGLFISSSYQPALNDPVCKGYAPKDPKDHFLKGVDELPWWQSWFVNSVCDEHSEISGFLLRFGISITSALSIALILNFIFSKWRNSRPQYVSKFKAKVGNETWTMRTTLKITKDPEEIEKPAIEASDGAGAVEAPVITPTETEEDDKDKEDKKERKIDPEEAMKFLFQAIEKFGKSTDLSKDIPSLQPLFQSADICVALSHFDKNALHAWPQVIANLMQKAKAEVEDKNNKNQNNRTRANNDMCIVPMQSETS